MRSDSPTDFTRLADGTLLQRQPDGSFRTVASATDQTGLAALADGDVERLACADPDHPALDDAFWNAADAERGRETISITLDEDVLRYFRRDGEGYQGRINAVLRRFVLGRMRAG